MKRCKAVVKKMMDEGEDWREGIKEMRNIALSSLGEMSPAEVFYGGRRWRPAAGQKKNNGERLRILKILLYHEPII